MCPRPALCLSVDIDASGSGADLAFFGEVELEHAVLIFGGDVLHLHARDVEAAGIRAAVALAPDEVRLFLFLLLAVLGTHGEAVAVDVDMDILLAKAGQLCLQDISIAFIEHIGAAGQDGFVKILEEGPVEIVEHVHQLSFIAAQGHQFKHNHSSISFFCYFIFLFLRFILIL